MAEAHCGFASTDGTKFHSTDNSLLMIPSAIARRSVSIFSRKGTETPEPKSPIIAPAAVTPMGRTPKPVRERQKGWGDWKISVHDTSVRSAGGLNSPKLPKGTTLNAVPPAKTIKMTALEEEMASSPNEEIMCAINEPSPTQIAFTSVLNLTPTSQQTNAWKSTPYFTHRTKSQKQRDTDTRIGVWVDGIVHWDENGRKELASWQDQIVEEDLGFTPIRSVPTVAPTTIGAKPTLSVIIPDKSSLSKDLTISRIVQSKPQRPVVPIGPAAFISGVGPLRSAIKVEDPHDISPLEPSQPLSTQPRTRPGRPHPPVHREIVRSPSKVTNKPLESRASLSSNSSVERDGSSVASKRSSATSLEIAEGGTPEESKKRISRKSLPRVERFSDTTPRPEDTQVAAGRYFDVNKPLPPSPMPPRKRIALAPAPLSPSSNSRNPQTLPKAKSIRSRSGNVRDDTSPMVRNMYLSRSFIQRNLPDQSEISEPSSPTLSQAEIDLKAHLSTIAEYTAPFDDQRSMTAEPSMSRTTSVWRGDSVRSVMQPPERAPTIPRRSRKREWRLKNKHVIAQIAAARPERTKSESRRQMMSDGDAENVGLHAAGIRRSMSAVQIIVPQIDIPETEPDLGKAEPKELVDSPTLPRKSSRRGSSPQPPTRIVIDDGSTAVGEEESLWPVAAASAEDVLVNVLSSLTSLNDLTNTAIINKGMYRIYKEHEMHLIRTVLYNQSPAAWEFMEWSLPERDCTTSWMTCPDIEYTPLSYIRSYKRDLAVIQSLKALILERCQTFIRSETAFALATRLHPDSQRFDDAFWRIWCFCKIFGYSKNREEDITGQLDWLKGGLLANNQNAVATVNMNLDFDVTSILLTAPEYFARGNPNGLSAQQLYDVTEIWTCLVALMQGFQGRVDQARTNHIFEGCDTIEGDDDMEEHLLEEWTYYILTLGPAVVLELAEFASDSSSVGFALARESGLAKWSPPACSGSRNTFLKEPVSRLYEERVAAATRRLRNPREREKKETSRKRVATLAAEIRLARQSSRYKRLPLIDMNNERPMSIVHRNDSMVCSSQGSSNSSVYSRQYVSPGALTPSTPRFSSSPQSSGLPGLWSPRTTSPVIEDRVEKLPRVPLRNFEEIAEDTGDWAINKIVEMGFTRAQAREALEKTDIGDGLRVDRAVDLLLRQR